MQDATRRRKSKMAADKPETPTCRAYLNVLKFRLLVTSSSNRNSAIELLDLEDIDLALGISLLNCLEAEK